MIEHSLPPQLKTSELGSFARKTIVERKPQIIQKIIDSHNYPPQVIGALSAFRKEIAEGMIQPVVEKAPDAAFWNEQAAAHDGESWLQLPWYFAETFFYRRLLEAVQYFQPGRLYLRDPFAPQKELLQQAAVEWWAANGCQIEAVVPDDAFELLLHSCLWGNRADLSNFTVRELVKGGLAASQERRNILIDDTEKVARWLSSGVSRVDFVNDNAGQELLSDLTLADFLLREGGVASCVLHVKSQPFFVSDAMCQDVEGLVASLQAREITGDSKLGSRLSQHLTSGRLILKDDAYWTTCLTFRQMPTDLVDELARADLVILKGDVNYRRLLDDRHWPHTTTMEEAAGNFPAPFVALRTLKGEILVGLEPGRAEELAVQDPDWLISGKLGLIDFLPCANPKT